MHAFIYDNLWLVVVFWLQSAHASLGVECRLVTGGDVVVWGTLCGEQYALWHNQGWKSDTMTFKNITSDRPNTFQRVT